MTDPKLTPREPPPLQGGMSNDELLSQWKKKLPRVKPSECELSAFAVGAEVGFARARDLERQDWDRVHHTLAKHGEHPGRTDDHLADVIDRALTRLKAAAELRRLAALSESNAIDALNYESRIERLQAENDALRAMHDAAPKVEAEPVAFMWQHDETGRTGFCSRFDLENGFESNNPRLKIVGPLYTHPAAPQPDALPDLSDAEIGRLVDRMDNTHDSDLLKFARAVIAAMKGKQWAINEYL